MKTLAIIGSGQLGQQIARFAIMDNHYEKIVFFDDFSEEDSVAGYRILGKTNEILERYSTNDFDELIIGVGYNHMKSRKAFFEKYQGKIPFGKVIHSSAHIDTTATLGDGVVIYPRCIVDAHTTIENNVLLNIGATVAHDSIVQNHCFVSPCVAIAGFSTIGEQCILGINATIIDSIIVNANTRIGGGGVVIKNIEKSGLYVGNPVRFIRENDTI